MNGWFGKIGAFLIGCVGIVFGFMFAQVLLLCTILAGAPYPLSLRGIIGSALEVDPFLYWPIAICVTSCIVCIRYIQNRRDAILYIYTRSGTSDL
ncbi:MAG: hypothetical protein Q7R73_01185 [bacterium]|nr:hypothetical protein [bacterium]